MDVKEKNIKEENKDEKRQVKRESETEGQKEKFRQSGTKQKEEGV